MMEFSVLTIVHTLKQWAGNHECMFCTHCLSVNPKIAATVAINDLSAVVTVQLIMGMGHQGLVSQRVYEHIILIFQKLS